MIPKIRRTRPAVSIPIKPRHRLVGEEGEGLSEDYRLVSITEGETCKQKRGARLNSSVRKPTDVPFKADIFVS
jgi:hypothetical protein